MANYNPNAPIILGEEWVPIREENLAFNEQVNNLEMGHSFTLSTSTQLSVGRFYVNKPPTSGMDNMAYTMAVYPKGQEDKSGPIHSVIIPCNAVGATGLPSQIGTLDNVTRLSNSSADPDLGILMNIGSATQKDVAMFFATNQYANLLNGKRILGLNFLSNARFTNVNGVVESNIGAGTNGAFLQIRNEGNTNRWNFPIYADDFSPQRTNNPRTDRIGDVDRFFGGSVANVPDTIPMTYAMLQKFEATAGVTRIHMHMRIPISNPVFLGPNVYLNYAALEVFYCEETRVAFGTKIYNPWNQSPFLTDSPVMGGILQQTNPIIMRDLAGNANPVLPAGDYVVTVSEANLGDDLEVTVNAGPHAELNALRELYQIPNLVSRSVNIPFPLDSGATSTPHTFTAESTHILPQLSLHASGGATFTELHAYGRQAIAQVYGTITATQDIADSPATAGTAYPWARFYARRFGETTVPLRLSSTSPATSGSGFFVQITPAQWDALPEILDRWKEVTLRFPDATPPRMGGGFNPAWTWSATGETAGNRWEVLGACAPALSGLPGNLLNLAVPPASQLGPATYGAGGTALASSFISAGAAAHANNASVAPGMPPGILQGDLLLIDAAIRNSPNGIPDTPTGYTLLLNAVNHRVFGKYYDGVEVAPTITFTGGIANATTSAQMAAFRNVSTSVVASATQLNGSGINIAYPGIAVGSMEANTLVLYLGWRAADWVSVATIAGATEIGEPSTGAGDNQGLVWDYQFNGAAAAISSGSFVVNDPISDISRGSVLVLRQATQPGSQVELTWMPQGVGSAYVTSPTPDPTSDGVLMFSQDPAPVSGFAISSLTQALSGIGQQCGLNPIGIPTSLSYQRLTWTSPASTGYVTELQRMDTVDTTWQTIMLSSNTAVSGFNDYEARVGILSSYRIRRLNTYGFYGPWSTTLTATIAAPGVAVGVTGGHVLIFTTNSRQTGSSNLAYLPIWDSGTTIDEDFTFPEAGFVTAQAMYNKDFFTTFRPLERGGERFQRTILVQAAAIAPETLGDFTSLRNMAWDSVPYICVRDEDGNRWFANINVPSGRVQRARRLYEATIDIIEVSDTPSQVDP